VAALERVCPSFPLNFETFV